MEESPARVVAFATVILALANLAFLGINARATRRHEVRMLRETRLQQRLETTYLEFVTLMHHVAAEAHMILSQTPIAAGDLTTSREISGAVGRINTFGSDNVIERVHRWAYAHGEMVVAAVGGRAALAQQRLTELQQEAEAVREAMRKELEP